uniref:Ulp1 protease family, C-terminal catalytic domain-containing protein n=1 Tax=Tanacetum cinerariifolium TaxID=118510 RepID=A0A6L2P9W2_TANCI|nr:ulp1 protease family, C-terminal catalytic domain-containing protein [Tanacetum cinerariifolium]
MIQNLEDIMRACVIDFGGSYHLSIRCAPFEALYERKAYRLRLPEELNSLHDTFHVSNLKRCLADANLHVPLDEIKVDKTLRFVEEPVEIMDQEIKKLKGLLVGIDGLFSRRYCGVVRRVTCGYPWLGLGGNHRDFDINKSSTWYIEDNLNDEDNEDSHSAGEEQNTEDSDSIKTPYVKKRGRPKKIFWANENKSSSVKRRGRSRKSNDDLKKQTIGSKRKGKEYKVEDDDDNDRTKRMKKKMDHKEAKVKRKRNQKNTKRKVVDESSFEFEVTTTSSKGKKHKKNIKISNENKKNIKIRTRTTPTTLFNAMAILNVDRKKCLYEMGFGSMIGMAIHELPGMLGFYVIDNLDTETNVSSLTDKFILVTSQSVHDILGIPIGGCSLESLASRSLDDPFIKEWFSQFGEKNEVRPNDITDVIGIDNDDTTGIDMESDSPDCQMESDSPASDDDNQKNDKVDDSCPATRVCFVIERDEVKFIEVEDVKKEEQQIGNEDDRVVDDSVTTIPDYVTEKKEVKFIKNDNVLVDDVHNKMIKCSFEVQKKDSLNECDAIVQDSVERSEHSLEKEKKKISNEELRSQSLKGNTYHATGLYSSTEGDEATEHEDVHHILNEDDKVDDSCPATGVCSVIEGDGVKLTEVEDVEKEKQQIGNEDDRVVDDSDTTIPDSKKKYSLNESNSVERSENSLEKEKKKVSNEELRFQSLKSNVGAEGAVDSQHTIGDIFKQDEQIQSAEDVKKPVSDVEKIIADTLIAMTRSKLDLIFESQSGLGLNHLEMETLTPTLMVSAYVIDVWEELLNILEMYKDESLPLRYFFKITIYRKVLVQYLYYVKHPKAKAIEKAKILRMKMSWRITRNSNDCGVFTMLYMESYIRAKGEWKCGLAKESKKQNEQLNSLRSKFAAKIILSEFNLLRENFMKLVADRWTWVLENSGEFTVSSVRKHIDDKLIPGVGSKTRWIKYVPIKVNLKAWKVKLDALPTRFNVVDSKQADF